VLDHPGDAALSEPMDVVDQHPQLHRASLRG
jgi:hypothetical protein